MITEESLISLPVAAIVKITPKGRQQSSSKSIRNAQCRSEHIVSIIFFIGYNLLNYANIIGIVDTLNEWNEKLRNFTTGKTDNVFVGTLIIGGIFVVSAWAISYFGKH